MGILSGHYRGIIGVLSGSLSGGYRGTIGGYWDIVSRHTGSSRSWGDVSVCVCPPPPLFSSPSPTPNPSPQRLRNPKAEKAEILQKTVQFLRAQPQAGACLGFPQNPPQIPSWGGNPPLPCGITPSPWEITPFL